MNAVPLSPPIRVSTATLALALTLALAAPPTAARAAEPEPVHGQGPKLEHEQELEHEPAPATTSAPVEPAAFELRVFDDHAFEGDVLYYEVAWTNRGADPVEVPADLLTRLWAKAEYVRAEVRMGTGAAFGDPHADAAKAAWVTVRPGERLQRIGPLADLFTVCHPGCPAGTYDLQLIQPARVWSGLAPSQREPMAGPLTWHRELTSPTPAEGLAPIGPGPGLEVTLAVVGRQGRYVDLRARVTNRLGAPIWVPKPAFWNVLCEGRVLYRDDLGTASVEGRRGGPTRGWGPADGRLLRPGQHLDLPFQRMTSEATGVVSQHLTATLTPSTSFAPGSAEVEVPFYFAGTLRTPEVRIR